MDAATVTKARDLRRPLSFVRPKALVKRLLRRYRPTVLFPYPASSLAPERLYAYLDALWRRRHLDGAILEVGCWVGGTSAIAAKMMRRTGFAKPYVCVDTFTGFVTPQFENDSRRHGTPVAHRRMFDQNSLQMVRRLLDHYGCPEIELVQGDIVTMRDDSLPAAVAVCLLDVDLEIPVYEGLRRIFPRLVQGGVILVDDCPDKTSWGGARVGYRRFAEEHGLPETYHMGMGVVGRPATGHSLDDALESAPDSRLVSVGTPPSS